MAFDFSTLVTDRTQADVAAGNAKGTYNAADLNRVSAAVKYIAERFASYGYFLLLTALIILLPKMGFGQAITTA